MAAGHTDLKKEAKAAAEKARAKAEKEAYIHQENLEMEIQEVYFLHRLILEENPEIRNQLNHHLNHLKKKLLLVMLV